MARIWLLRCALILWVAPFAQGAPPIPDNWLPGGPLDQSAQPMVFNSGLVSVTGGVHDVLDTDLGNMAPIPPAPFGILGCTRLVWVFDQCFGGGMFDELNARGGKQSMLSASRFSESSYYPLNPPAGTGFDMLEYYIDGLKGGPPNFGNAIQAANQDPWGPSKFAFRKGEQQGLEHPGYRALGPFSKNVVVRKTKGGQVAILWAGQPEVADTRQLADLIVELVGLGFRLNNDIFLFYKWGKLPPKLVATGINPVHVRAAKKANLGSFFGAMYGNNKRNPALTFFVGTDHGFSTDPNVPCGGVGGGGGPDPDAPSDPNDPDAEGGGDMPYEPDDFPMETTPPDCNSTDEPDVCDVLADLSEDVNGDSVPDECQSGPPDSGQQACISALNKRFVKLVKTRGTETCKCIKDFSNDKLGDMTLEECVHSDRKGKIAKDEDKLIADYAKRCLDSDPPLYGATDAITMSLAAAEKELALVHDVFGSDLDTAIVLRSADKDAAKCQELVAKAVKKCQDAKLKEFDKCKQAALKAGSVDDPADLEACLGADPKGKIAKECAPSTGKLRKALDVNCAAKGVDLDLALPGACSGSLTAHAACLDARVECRVCLAVNQADRLAVDCDLFDDAQVNSSCGP